MNTLASYGPGPRRVFEGGRCSFETVQEVQTESSYLKKQL